MLRNQRSSLLELFVKQNKESRKKGVAGSPGTTTPAIPRATDIIPMIISRIFPNQVPPSLYSIRYLILLPAKEEYYSLFIDMIKKAKPGVTENDLNLAFFKNDFKVENLSNYTKL